MIRGPRGGEKPPCQATTGAFPLTQTPKDLHVQPKAFAPREQKRASLRFASNVAFLARHPVRQPVDTIHVRIVHLALRDRITLEDSRD